MGISYFDIGYQAGEMAVEILNGADPSTMPVQYANKSNDIMINGIVAEEIGFEIPEEFAEFVFFPGNE